MARLPRIDLPNVPQHIIQRGNNRQVCFASEQDFQFYAHLLKEYAQQFSVEIHAWVFMTNHIHLLCTPKQSKAVSYMMQSIGRRYVRYFNDTYQRTGTLWEGRFKSCFVEETNYLLHLYRYIEMNPVRAGMVDTPADYIWSSYQFNALGKSSSLCTPHDTFLQLGKDEFTRQKAYRNLFKFYIDSELLNNIRSSSNKGLALGNDRFKAQIELLTGKRVTEMKRGRPIGWRKQSAI